MKWSNQDNLSQVYPDAWVSVDFRYGQVDNQDQPLSMEFAILWLVYLISFNKIFRNDLEHLILLFLPLLGWD